MNKIKEFIKNNRELISYVFWGGMTTVVSWVVYFICRLCLPESFSFLTENLDTNTVIYKILNVLLTTKVISNIISWIISVAFAYVVNKLFVFESKSWEAKLVFREVWQFVSARLVSFILADWLIFALLVEVCGFNDLIVKIIVNVIVIIMNYIFSKLVIFKKK